jgi:hypothetical protein
MEILRRLFRSDNSTHREAAIGEPPATPAVQESVTEPVTERPTEALVARVAPACPSCAELLDPPPTRSRLCPRCRQPIVVRRVGGRIVLLTEEALPIFEAQRQRTDDEAAWTAARKNWLELARDVGAPQDRLARLASAAISEAAVAGARDLYLRAAERAVRAARREKRWGAVGRVRRRQAQAMYEEAGNPLPVPDEILALSREGIAALLRSLQEVSRDAELAGGQCCAACRADEGRVTRISNELRMPTLPHVTCPRGLCGCDWWPVSPVPRAARKRTRRRRCNPGAS